MNVLIISLVVLLVAQLVIITVLYLKAQGHKQKAAVLAARNQELNTVIHSSELQSLRYKLNPHLFKNALNSIQSHAYQTYHAVDKLSGVLDYILYESDQPLVPLAEEMDFAMSFIEINRLKVSPLFELSVKNSITPEQAALFRTLPLVTVDLIENAFKHTDFQKSGSFISIVFQLKESQFLLEVRNRMSEKDILKKQRGGMGLETLRERLNIAYPDTHKLVTERKDNVFFAQLQLHLNA